MKRTCFKGITAEGLDLVYYNYFIDEKEAMITMTLMDGEESSIQIPISHLREVLRQWEEMYGKVE